eukprot:CAMPEP_0118853214 /NCGR_PEP_ID=MMETSP1163-20130328/1888_1 /TAXON_ID=124430 /ORGANISM="Phaeomonas parva, Strain CCMP2877" /LENGTH=125 /DNA_ID=CAMNT_0006785727 /DNA_START=150 /DNA_END=524 /DNA_ORIENTATION=+
MGRRKGKSSQKKIVASKKAVIPKSFKCPFCNNDEAVDCTMDWKRRVGELKCRFCGAEYQMAIHYLHEPIDVYSEWIDDCEQANAEGGGGAAYADDGDDYDAPRGASASASAKAAAADEDDDGEDL